MFQSLMRFCLGSSCCWWRRDYQPEEVSIADAILFGFKQHLHDVCPGGALVSIADAILFGFKPNG